MATKCSLCKKRNDCQSILWSPDCYHSACDDFELDNFSSKKKKKLFAVVLHNHETNVFKVLNIHDDEKLANVEAIDLRSSICKRPSSHISISVKPCSFDYSKILSDDILIDIVHSVAQDLFIAELGFKKGYFKQETFNKTRKWFDFAHSACRRGAAILDIINND